MPYARSEPIVTIKLTDAAAFDIPAVSTLKVTKTCLDRGLIETCEVKRGKRKTVKVIYSDYSTMQFWCEVNLAASEISLIAIDSGDEQLNFLLITAVAENCINLLTATAAVRRTSMCKVLTQEILPPVKNLRYY